MSSKRRLRAGWSATVVVLIVALSPLGCWPGSDSNEPVQGTGVSVVVVVVDTLRADHLSLHGYPRETSPMLEKWSDRSAVFERAYATSPWTLPSFASIYTGLLPSRHAAGYLVNGSGDDRHLETSAMTIHGKTTHFAQLDDSVATLAEILKGAGYATGAVLNNPFLNDRFGIARGFDHYDHDEGGDARSRRADAMIDNALSWIDDHSDRPFFFLLHLFDPHMNYDAPEPVRGRYTAPALAKGFTLPVENTAWLRDNASKLDRPSRRFVVAAYDEEVAFVDAELGRFYEALESRGLMSNTLVFLTADHGEELFDHGSFGHGQTMYEEQLRVPLTVTGAGVKGARHQEPVSIADVTPTVLDALGLESPIEFDGVSLWSAAKGEGGPPSREIFAERRGVPPERKAVIRWPYKLSAEADGNAARLVDLEADPGETKNIASSHPEVYSALAERLVERYELDAGSPSREAARLDPSTVDELRALGYVD